MALEEDHTVIGTPTIFHRDNLHQRYANAIGKSAAIAERLARQLQSLLANKGP